MSGHPAMETITPPPTPPGPPGSPPGSPRSLPSVIVSNPPAALSKLSAGTQFEGTISTSAGRTTVQVTTQYGTLQLQTILPLEQGARLSLILQNLIPEARVQLAAINGQPPHLVLRGGAPGQQASPAAAGGTAQPAVTATVSPQGLIGTNVMATFLRPFGANPAQTGVSPASTAPIPGGATPGG
ncbi:MAG: hypothetical protein MI741_23160, partial [Rhodospirillales bacterium]|nr:hypothetical protein [Rhodospirillales bacterium]